MVLRQGRFYGDLVAKQPLVVRLNETNRPLELEMKLNQTCRALFSTNLTAINITFHDAGNTGDKCLYVHAYYRFAQS